MTRCLLAAEILHASLMILEISGVYRPVYPISSLAATAGPLVVQRSNSTVAERRGALGRFCAAELKEFDLCEDLVIPNY